MSSNIFDDLHDDEYIIAEARKLYNIDSSAAKAYIITAKTLFPSKYEIQIESYKLEKESNNYQEAAKCFSLIGYQCFQNVEMRNEINELITALRATEHEITPEQEFYVKMFKHVSLDVQHEVLLHTVNHTENSLNQCKLLLLILKRFPQAAITHSHRLLEMIAEGMKVNPQKYQELLVDEDLPAIYQKTPEISPLLVCRLFTVSLEYFIRRIIDDETNCDSNDTWNKIFKILMLCGKVLRWETFLPFNKNWGQNIYWDKLIEIVSVSPTGSTQVLFYATTLFIYSLHCYIKNCYIRVDDAETNHVLVEGFTEWKMERTDAQSMEPPQISLTTTASKEISKAFVHAAQCWQLLNTEQFQRDFSKLLLALPLASWISRFLFDLAIYFGHQEEAKKLMSEMSVKSNLVQSIQILSLNLLQGSLTLQGFQCILKILAELPTTPGKSLEHLTLKVPRHMIFIPLTQRALVQYCAKAIVTSLGRKLYEPNCTDKVLGDLLVLLQLDYPRETLMAEQIFSLITSRQSFVYSSLPSYIVTIDFVEELSYIWHSHNEDFNFVFSQSQTPPPPPTGCNTISARRIGTRGADKEVRDDFRSIIKQQILRANENLTTLVANFISQEHMSLIHNVFGSNAGDSVIF